MVPLLRAELLKLKGSWLFRLSFILALFFPLLTLVMTLAGTQVAASEESRFLMLLRQNHIFLTMLMGNLLAALIAVDLFHKEFQHGTIADIIAVPVPRIRFLLAKEAVLFAWTAGLALFTYLACLVLGGLAFPQSVTLSTARAALWRYTAAAAIQFLVLQPCIWITLAFKNYFVPLGFSIAAMVGTVVAFNMKDIIFLYPFSIGFVLTNFVKPVAPGELATSLAVLAVMTAACASGILARFRRMDL
jgi:bacitracin transport system permease protein